jgi:hypothetical protein
VRAQNDRVIVDYLAGRLDTTGHKVEVIEREIGSTIVKHLVIDGEEWCGG